MPSRFSNRYSAEAGFTLVEMAVVAAIIGLISTSIIINFSRTRVDLAQSANLVSAAIRFAQSQAISSAKYQGSVPCGYGFHYIDGTHFAVYAGPNAATTNCAAINRNYDPAQDSIVKTYVFLDPKVHFTGAFNDIYFEPPDPKTYLNNSNDLSQGPISTSIGVIGGTCPQNCQTINVYPSGIIDSQ